MYWIVQYNPPYDHQSEHCSIGFLVDGNHGLLEYNDHFYRWYKPVPSGWFMIVLPTWIAPFIDVFFPIETSIEMDVPQLCNGRLKARSRGGPFSDPSTWPRFRARLNLGMLTEKLAIGRFHMQYIHIYIDIYIIYINPAKILDTPKCCFRMNGSGWTRRTYQFRDPMGQRITNDQQSVGSRTLPARKGIPPAASGFSATLWRQRGTNTGFVIQDLAMEDHRSQRVNHPFILQFSRATVS